jgi:alpha-D-ribose 1-methylphosphonate 5-phosphate C-P lyase
MVVFLELKGLTIPSYSMGFAGNLIPLAVGWGKHTSEYIFSEYITFGVK